MTDIQALKKAAEAARDAREKLRDAEGSGNYDYLYGRAVFLERMLGTRLTPATVLELCRLAEIGRRYENEQRFISEAIMDTQP